MKMKEEKKMKEEYKKEKEKSGQRKKEAKEKIQKGDCDHLFIHGGKEKKEMRKKEMRKKMGRNKKKIKKKTKRGELLRIKKEKRNGYLIAKYFIRSFICLFHEIEKLAFFRQKSRNFLYHMCLFRRTCG